MAKKTSKSKNAKTTKINFEDSLKLQRDLKLHTYKSSLKRIQNQMPKHLAGTSRVMHHGSIDTLNEVLAKTIARPVSLMVGSIFSFIGVFLGIYLAKDYGYSYNYLLFFLFFIIGYVLEIFIELIIRFFVRFT